MKYFDAQEKNPFKKIFLIKFVEINLRAATNGFVAGKNGLGKKIKKNLERVLTKAESRCILSKLDSRGSLKTEQCKC